MVGGDATEAGLLKFAESVLSVEGTRMLWPKVVEIPFNSTTKYQLSIHLHSTRNEHLLVMKGAPERITTRCSTIMIDGQAVPFTAELRDQVAKGNEQLAERGERVLGQLSFSRCLAVCS